MSSDAKTAPPGFRTYMLTALGATLTVLLSLQLDQMLHGPWREVAESIGATQDVSRFGAEAAKGHRLSRRRARSSSPPAQQVKGLTTAAGLWASACLGLTIGAGFYACAFICIAYMAACMYLLPPLEQQLTRRAHHINISLEIERMEHLGAIGRASARREHPHFRLCRQPQRHRPAGELPVPVQRHPARAARPPRAAGRAVGARGRHPHRRDLRKEAVPCCIVLIPSVI